VAFIRNKPKIRDGIKFDYYCIVENQGEGNKTKQKVLEYIGPLEGLKDFALKLYSETQGKEQSQSKNAFDNLSFKAYKHGSTMALF
jgi:hypothetical protein